MLELRNLEAIRASYIICGAQYKMKMQGNHVQQKKKIKRSFFPFFGSLFLCHGGGVVLGFFFSLINVMFPWARLVTGQLHSPTCTQGSTLKLGPDFDSLCPHTGSAKGERWYYQVTGQGWGSRWQKTHPREAEKQQESRQQQTKALNHQCLLQFVPSDFTNKT